MNEKDVFERVINKIFFAIGFPIWIVGMAALVMEMLGINVKQAYVNGAVPVIKDITPEEYTDGIREKYVERTYEWTGYMTGDPLEFTLAIDEDMYNYYSSFDRYILISQFTLYATEEYNQEIALNIVESFDKYIYDLGYDDTYTAYELTRFVQEAIRYEPDVNVYGESIEYPKYPIETLYSKSGDCEDKAILLAALLKAYGYDAALIEYDTHMTVGICLDEYDGSYYEVDGKKYFFIETTDVWEIGEVPDEFVDADAYVHVLD